MAPRWLIVPWPLQQCSVIEKDLKLVCQESAMVVRWRFDSFSGLFQDPVDDTSIKGHRSNTKKYSTVGLERSNICKYGSTNMQCQLLVIILMMMKAVKILIQFNRYCLSFLCQKQPSTTYHFFPQIPWACQKYILTVLLDVPLRSPTN